jgi:hypothetical protein
MSQMSISPIDWGLGLGPVFDKPLLEGEESFETGETLLGRTAPNPVLIFGLGWTPFPENQKQAHNV